MKTKIIIIVTFFATVSLQKASAQTPQYTWEYVSSLQNEWLNKIYTQGLDTIYIVGRNGLIAKSTDRAATWTKQYPATVELNDIVFCNHTTGFAIGDNGAILRTTDAGASWTPQSSDVTVNLNAIAATGADNIWAVGDSGRVIFSTNAGVTWQKKDFSISTKLNDVSFRNNEGYIVGDTHVCLFSSDKGTNWNNKDIALNSNEPNQTALSNTNQTNSHTCILIGYNDFMGSSINVDNNKIIQLPPAYSPVKNFTMKNDSIGYGVSIGCATGCFLSMLAINILHTNNSQSYLINLPSYVNTEKVDINFVNDSIEYICAGFSLFHLKRYVPDIQDGLNNVSNNKLSITNNASELTIQFAENKIYQIELYSITGMKILSENVSNYITRRSINTVALSNGIYIIRACNSDNTYTNIKWIKQ